MTRWGETGSGSESGHSDIRGEFGGDRPDASGVVRVPWGSSTPEPGAEYLGHSPVRRYSALSAWEVELIGLVGSTEVPALLIPGDGHSYVTKTEFDLDKIWRYDAVGYDKNRVFLTEKHAYLDHLTNSLATDWVQNHSDAAKNPDSRLPSPDKLYGPVYVIARDPLMEWITRSTTQLDKLKHALGWIDPFRASD